jgi:hypothetical protein
VCTWVACNVPRYAPGAIDSASWVYNVLEMNEGVNQTLVENVQEKDFRAEFHRSTIKKLHVLTLQNRCTFQSVLFMHDYINRLTTFL